MADSNITKRSSTVEPLGFRPKDVAKALGIGLTLATELIRKGEIESIRIGRAIVVPRASLDVFLARKLDTARRVPA